MMLPEIFSAALQEAGVPFSVESASHPFTIRLDAAKLVNVCTLAFHDPRFYFDQLSCVTGIDNGPEAGTMEVIYHLYSIALNHALTLKVVLPRDTPEVESISSIWKSANWLEREVFDMFGIRFLHHPDLRRILMPADWQGFPLRKDDVPPEEYLGIKVAY